MTDRERTTDDILVSLALPPLVPVPGGRFVMGRANTRKDEAPPHEVTVLPFRAAVTPVTNAEYARFVAETAHEPPPFLDDARFSAPGQPVVGVNWFDAAAYCEWLSSRTGTAFRLPTEAEREFASLGGLSDVDWPWESDAHPLDAEISAATSPHVPDEACANGYGLRCMGENVHEWCADWYDAAYYSDSPPRDPRGPATGRRRVSRGGSWRHSVKYTRLTARASLAPEFRYNDFGFRVYADA